MDGRRRPKPENDTSTFKDDASTFKGACRRPRIFDDGYGECVPADVLPRIHHLPPLVIPSLVSFLLCAGWLPRIWTHDLQLLQQLDDPTHEPSPLPHGSASSYPAPLTWAWDPPYQGKSGVVWAREVLVYQVKLLLPLILPLLIMPAALPCLFSPFISFKIFLNVIIVTIVQSSKRNTKGNKMQ
uniref:Uncharacterized protein n=1 Tax=Aegilops tauschii subsp. strangulata TaxID=200361 RepID=A0A453SPU1_AEGTS